jgi:hypothetical protein
MGNAVGQIESLKLKREEIVIPEDMEINLWLGGKVVTEPLHNQGGATPKVAFRAGCLTGITARAAKSGALKKIVDILQESVAAPVDCIVTMPNGDKYSAPVFGQWDDGSFYNSGDGKAQFAVYAPDGYFNPVG